MKHDLNKLLHDIEIALVKIDGHLTEVKEDIKEMKKNHVETELKVNELLNFKSKVLGAGTIIIAIATFAASIGHDLIKKLMGWN